MVKEEKCISKKNFLEALITLLALIDIYTNDLKDKNLTYIGFVWQEHYGCYIVSFMSMSLLPCN